MVSNLERKMGRSWKKVAKGVGEGSKVQAILKPGSWNLSSLNSPYPLIDSAVFHSRER